MKTTRFALIVGVAIGLLAGSAVGVDAQEATEGTAPDDGMTPDCVVTEGTDVPTEECVEDELVVLPVADYWVEWIDHKQASHVRATKGIEDARRSGSKSARWYQALVEVHKDELEWLDNHQPLACYSDEYERWRGAVEDLRSIHAKALPFVRAKNVSALRRIIRQRPEAMKRLQRALSNVALCGPSEPDTADATSSGNPLLGTWETVRRFVNEEGVNVTHQASAKITRDGGSLLRVKRDDFCRKSGLGFVPLTVEGRGEFVTDGALRFDWSGSGLYCHPRGAPRKLVLEGSSNVTSWRYDEAYDVLIGVQGGGNCSWRAKTGGPRDCKAFWRGTPAPVEDVAVQDDAAPAEGAEAPVGEGE